MITVTITRPVNKPIIIVRSIPRNLLTNNNLELWSNGASSAPDDWILTGTGATVARESTIKKLGSYSAKIDCTAGNYTILKQNFYTTRGIDYWQGKTITFGCWVYSDYPGEGTGAGVGIGLYNGATNSYIYHNGDSTWHWLTKTAVVDASATSIYPQLFTNQTGKLAYFDGAILVEGPSIIANSNNIQSKIVNLQYKYVAPADDYLLGPGGETLQGPDGTDLKGA